MSDTQEKLAPCPFCGNEEVVFNETHFAHSPNSYVIYCDKVECNVQPQTRSYNRKDFVIKAWNTRSNSDE